MADELWIIDASSLIELKHVVPRAHWKKVFDRLGGLVEGAKLAYPSEVVDELERHESKEADMPLAWARRHKKVGTRFGPVPEELADVMRHAIARRVCDPDAEHDEADPHVLALALHVRKRGHVPIIITEEKRNRETKLAISQACGALRLSAYSVRVFLEEQAIWPE